MQRKPSPLVPLPGSLALYFFLNRLLKSLTGGVPLRGPRTTHRSLSGFQVNCSTISNLSGRFVFAPLPPSRQRHNLTVPFHPTCCIPRTENTAKTRQVFFFIPMEMFRPSSFWRATLFVQRHLAAFMAHCTSWMNTRILADSYAHLMYLNVNLIFWLK